MHLQDAASNHGLAAGIDALQQRFAVAVQEEAAEVEVQWPLQVQIHGCHGAPRLQQNLQHPPQAVLIVGL